MALLFFLISNLKETIAISKLEQSKACCHSFSFIHSLINSLAPIGLYAKDPAVHRGTMLNKMEKPAFLQNEDLSWFKQWGEAGTHNERLEEGSVGWEVTQIEWLGKEAMAVSSGSQRVFLGPNTCRAQHAMTQKLEEEDAIPHGTLMQPECGWGQQTHWTGPPGESDAPGTLKLRLFSSSVASSTQPFYTPPQLSISLLIFPTKLRV